MSDGAPNPYAPPLAPDPQGAAGREWSVDGKWLVVREGGVLPPVDLFGKGDAPLTPMLVSLPAPRNLLIIVSMVPMILLLVANSISEAGFPVILVISIGTLLGKIGIWLFKIRTAPVQFLAYASVPALKAFVRRERIRRNLLLLSLAPMLAALGLIWLSKDASWGWAFLASGLLALLAAMGSAAWRARDQRWICKKERNGLLWVSGLPGNALAQMAAQPVPEEMPMHMRTVIRQDLSKMPEHYWSQAFGGGRWAGLRKFWAMANGKLPKERELFHESEAEGIPLSIADPELMRAWGDASRGTEMDRWDLVHVHRSGTPSGCERYEYAHFLSPDGHTTICWMVWRLATHRSLAERHATVIRSVAAEGNILLTVEEPWVISGAEGLEIQVVQGDLLQRLLAHRSWAARPMKVLNPKEFPLLGRRESDACLARMVELGLCGLPENREFPANWP